MKQYLVLDRYDCRATGVYSYHTRTQPPNSGTFRILNTSTLSERHVVSCELEFCFSSSYMVREFTRSRDIDLRSNSNKSSDTWSSMAYTTHTYTGCQIPFLLFSSPPGDLTLNLRTRSYSINGTVGFQRRSTYSMKFGYFPLSCITNLFTFFYGSREFFLPDSLWL